MNEIDYEDFYPALLIPDAELVFNTALDLMEDHFNEDSPRTTAVMTLTNEELVGQPPALVIILGESIEDSDKICSWDTNSREKAERLSQYKEHRSSWQSRVFEEKKYGGAVKTNDGEVLSLSGFTEFGDAAFCLVTLIMRDWMTLEEAEEIIKISGNDFFHKLYEACM